MRPTKAGPNRLAVDLPLLTGASPLQIGRDGRPAGSGAGLGELRLHEAGTGREIPYLLVWPARERPVTWEPTRVIPVSPGKDTSGFEADLARVLTVDRLEITDLPDRFLKRVRLEGSGDRVRWTMLVREGTLFNLSGDENQGDVPLRQTRLAFAPGAYRYLRVIWDDHAGGQLPTSLGARARIAPQGRVGTDSMRAVLTVDRRPSARRTSRYHLSMPASGVPIIALELDVRDPLVLRGARVTEPRLGAARLTPATLGTATLRRVTSGDAVAANLTVPIEPPSGAELDLIIDDGDNPPLELRAVRAVLAPLPFIFLNSPDGGVLRATYGGDRRHSYLPPRYDLEALRDSVDQIASAVATWDPPRSLAVTRPDSAARSELYAAPGAALDVKTFAFARSIPGGRGLTAIRLDPAALAHSRIDDVRIVDGESKQVPYVLEQLEEPTEVALPAPTPTTARESIDGRTTPNAARRSWYRVALPHAGLPGATIRLGTTARVFSRDVAIVTQDLPRDAQPDAFATRTVNGSWSHEDPDSPAAPLEVALGERLPTDSLFVLVNDGDNQKLPLSSATLLLPSYRIRFFRQTGASLTLVYGRRDLAAPSYDLALLTPRLLDAPAEDVVVDPESGVVQSRRGIARIVFWCVLAIAVAVLLAMIARLVRGGSWSGGPV
ncbi:MAG: hypothetical protein ABIP93_09890 [Gemmatimonadaceae bacterium]